MLAAHSQRGSDGFFLPKSVVETFENLRTQHVHGVGNVETGLLVKSLLIRRNGRRVPAEGFRPDHGSRVGVGVVAAVDERETEVNVLLLLENLASEDEVAAVETGQVLRRVDKGVVVERGEESQVGSRRGVRGQVRDGRVRGRDPAVAVVGVLVRVVDEHLDEVFVETVVAAVPASAGIQELAGLNVNVGTDQSWERLRACWLRV